MTFLVEYLDQSKYCSLTVAAQRSGYDYKYLARLVRTGVIRKAPITEAILVELASLNEYTKGRKL